MSSRLTRSTADELAPLLTLLDPAYPEDLGLIAMCLYLALLDQLPGNPSEHARLAFAQTELVRAEIGGGQIYLSKGRKFELSLRDRQILTRFTGDNHRELAREFGLTERQIYAILDRRGREEFKRRQGQLPGLDGES